MLKILGRKNSSNVQKVLWCCGELGIPFEREDYGGPFGKTRDAAYLANKYGDGALYPTDPAERGRGERWMDWQLSVLGPATHGVFWGLVRTAPEDRDMDAIRKSRQDSAAAMAILDRYLGQTEFAAGSNFSICDIPVGVFTFRWFNMDIEREEYPNLRRWYDRLGERAPYQEHIMNPLT